ncbi:DUF4416 family protein [bacterium]|nr:DUF4416 family protein [bacterium]MCI0604863.1 DUF4416 family protein [bacterium]
MARPASASPAKLFVVSLHRDISILETAIKRFKAEWGETDFESEDFVFDETDYYEPEMGAGLRRRFYSFEKLISPDRIVEAKLHCNAIEEQFLRDGHRQVNLDAGYLDTYKVILASAKFGGQKIYLRDGIYADMTLTMYKGKWESFVWGFPDFKSGKYDQALRHIRELYKTQNRQGAKDAKK